MRGLSSQEYREMADLLAVQSPYPLLRSEGDSIPITTPAMLEHMSFVLKEMVPELTTTARLSVLRAFLEGEIVECQSTAITYRQSRTEQAGRQASLDQGLLMFLVKYVQI